MTMARYRCWKAMPKAPRTGVTIVGRRNPEDLGERGQPTWWGVDSKGNTGWCRAVGPGDTELWQPDEWHSQGASVPLGKAPTCYRGGKRRAGGSEDGRARGRRSVRGVPGEGPAPLAFRGAD